MTTARRHLDLDAVQSFLLVSELKSFTRAAEVLQTTQAAVSQQVKRLEQLLGYRLLDRTPRRVDLSSRGEGFQLRARALLDAHQRALDEFDGTATLRLKFGISDHVAGPSLPSLLASLSAQVPHYPIDVKVASSRETLTAYDRNEIDYAIVRREGTRTDGMTLGREPVAWYGAQDFLHRTGEPLRLVTLASPCGMRDVAVRALEQASIPWVESFVGGGVHAVGAAVTAGLGVAALLGRSAPVGSIDVGHSLGLPMLPDTDIVYYCRRQTKQTPLIARALAAAFRKNR